MLDNLILKTKGLHWGPYILGSELLWERFSVWKKLVNQSLLFHTRAYVIYFQLRTFLYTNLSYLVGLIILPSRGGGERIWHFPKGMRTTIKKKKKPSLKISSGK